ncbi:MAG: hypothetical protein XD41_0410 [Desulfonauticus sp. 38_4375]|nr:MAG: hypothetical protein XD41_0410 [Desulfonauticus sp. 38_4375]
MSQSFFHQGTILTNSWRCFFFIVKPKSQSFFHQGTILTVEDDRLLPPITESQSFFHQGTILTKKTKRGT